MNKTEARALKWLAKTTGFPENTIIFSSNSSPDFTTPDGRGYEVKQRQKYRGIILYERQWLRLHKLHSVILVFGDTEVPEAIIPIESLPFETKRWDNLTIRCDKTGSREHIAREEFLRRLKLLRGANASWLAAHRTERQIEFLLRKQAEKKKILTSAVVKGVL